MVDVAPLKVYSLQKTQISSIITSRITLFKAYKDYKNMFSIKNTGHLPSHKYHDHAIDFIDSKQPLYRLIYSLSENKLSIFQAYIDKNLANRFIRPFKFLLGFCILFMSKPNGGLWLYVNYWCLNNLTIKN